MFHHKSHDPSKSKNCSRRKPDKSGTRKSCHKSSSRPYERKTVEKHSPWSNGNHKKKKKKVNDLSKSRNCSRDNCKSSSRGDWHRHHDPSLIRKPSVYRTASASLTRLRSGVKKKAHRGGTRCDMRRAHFSAGRMNAIKKCIRQTEDLDMDIEELGGGAWRCSFTGRNGRKVERVVDCPSHGHTCSERGDRDGAKTLYFSICEMLDNCYYPS